MTITEPRPLLEREGNLEQVKGPATPRLGSWVTILSPWWESGGGVAPRE